MFLIELVCKRKVTPSLEPLASASFAACPQFPSLPLLREKGRARGSIAAYAAPSLLPCTSQPSAAPEHSTASPSSLLCRGAFLAGQLRRRGAGAFFSLSALVHWARGCFWEQSAQQGRAKGELCVLHQCYQILPSMGFLFTGTLRKIVLWSILQLFPFVCTHMPLTPI